MSGASEISIFLRGSKNRIFDNFKKVAVKNMEGSSFLFFQGGQNPQGLWATS
jgi:hypothetical protein